MGKRKRRRDSNALGANNAAVDEMMRYKVIQDLNPSWYEVVNYSRLWNSGEYGPSEVAEGIKYHRARYHYTQPPA